MSEDSEESTKFIRQRRDLFVISGILLFTQLANVTFQDQAQLSGISIQVGKPNVINYFLWGLWAYWYWRYFQTYKLLGKNFFKDKFNTEMTIYLSPILTRMSDAKLDQMKETGELTTDGAAGFSLKEQKHGLLQAEYVYEFSAYEHSRGNVIAANKTLIYKKPDYYWMQSMAFFKCFFRHIEFTEYWLPFIFGALPLAIKLGLCNLFTWLKI